MSALSNELFNRAKHQGCNVPFRKDSTCSQGSSQKRSLTLTSYRGNIDEGWRTIQDLTTVSKARNCADMGLRECHWQNPFTLLWCMHWCRKTHWDFGVKYAAFEMKSFLGISMHFSTWQYKTTFCARDKSVAEGKESSGIGLACLHTWSVSNW